MKYLKRLSFALTLLAFTANSQAMPLQAPNIPVNGFFAVNKAQRGRNIKVAIVIDIPDGFHVNANKPLYRFAIPTVLKITARDLTISPVVYPRAAVLRLKAVNDEQLAVYERRAVLRFSVMVPTNFRETTADLKAQLKFQSCNDDTCFPPQTLEITMQIPVVGPNEHIKRVNSEIFGGGSKE